jgi:hypothetical protein
MRKNSMYTLLVRKLVLLDLYGIYELEFTRLVNFSELVT